ncbi:MAG: hypothetical protein IPN74_05095 [Haliscomenobacter sp.]|nr:hypothetical protein [Haliscomenobacter sp.]
MKLFRYLLGAFALMSLAMGCSELGGIDDDTSFLSTATSGNFSKVFDISNDNSGDVKLRRSEMGFLRLPLTSAMGPALLLPQSYRLASAPSILIRKETIR